MPQRLVFSLRYYNLIFQKYAKTALTLVFFLTLLRLNFFFLAVNSQLQIASFTEVYLSFFTGIRFDLLVFGFFLLPLVVVHLVQALAVTWPPWSLSLAKLYLHITWILSIILNWFDFLIFAPEGRRARWGDYSAMMSGSLDEAVQAVPLTQLAIYTGILALLIGLGVQVIRQIDFGHWKDSYSPQKGTRFELVWRMALPILLVGLAARGTVGNHHLRLEHSHISNDTRLNEMALNPMWCLDKH